MLQKTEIQFNPEKEREELSEYCYKLAQAKDDNNWTWKDLCEILLEKTGYHLNPDAFRKRVERFVDNLNAQEEQELLNSEASELNDLIHEIKKEKTKLSDERAALNADLRRMSREDSIKQIAHDFAVQMDAKHYLPVVVPTTPFGTRYGILCISDIHYGLEVDSAFNKYNREIAKERLWKLLAKVKQYCKKEKLSIIWVVNLGDLIAGRIHTTIRLNSRIDVITQTMEISELLAEFLYELSKVVKVRYISTSDNHSRIEPIKSESLELESLIRITDWYLKERCKFFVEFLNNSFGDDIATFSIGRYNIVATHGDKDKPSNAIQNLRLLTGLNYDICLLAHRHHFSADENCGTTLIANGSVCGTDKFAQDLRVHSKPSQNLIIVSEESPTECIYKINLD